MPTLTWIGKDKVVNHHHDVPYSVLEKVETFTAPEGTPENSTNNRIIHGDNLAVLKSLLPEFEGRVNCIYIDPPYNTGNEGWVYNDNVSDPRILKWLGDVVGKEGEDLTRHDKWLCMMYPRLKLLHRLLANDGVIFISLDDNEITNFRLVMNEIFGESNFLAQIIVQSNKRGQTYKQIAKTHEYLLCFGKTGLSELGELQTDGVNLPEKDKWGNYSSRELRNRNPKFGKFNRPNLFYPIYVDPLIIDEHGNHPVFLDERHGVEIIEPFNSLGIESCWRWGQEKTIKNTSDNTTKVLFAKKTREGNWRVFEKYRKESVKAKSIWFDSKFISEQGTTELGKLGLGGSFQFPKPVDLIIDCLQLIDNDESIVLDSFAGSGTTAHATLKLNAQDGGSRQFILCEMMDYADTITAERVRRVMTGYGEGNKKVEGLGGEFDYYQLGEPLFHGEYLNESVGIAKIRQYVAHSENIPLDQRVEDSLVSPSLLGLNPDTAWIFHYERDNETILDAAFLGTLKYRANGYPVPAHSIIYADRCVLTLEQLDRFGIRFKKIPRDITRL